MLRKCLSLSKIGSFVVAGMLLLATYSVVAQPPASAPSQKPVAQKTTNRLTYATMPDVVAEVNNTKITKAELAQESFNRHGKNYLESMVYRALIMQECKRRNVAITTAEVNQEITDIAMRFGFTPDRWLQTLKAERGIDYDQYANEMIWQMIALKKIAAQEITVTQAEIERQFVSMYGEGAQMRQIVAQDRVTAEKLLQEVMANPTKENFIAIAKQKSYDSTSAAMGGLIAPFRRFTLDDPQLENLIFQMQPDQISQVVSMVGGNYYVIFRCERMVPAQNVDKQKIQGDLRYLVEEKKLRTASARIFTELKNNSQITNFFDQPNAMTANAPKVVATVNNFAIERQLVAELCAVRYGETVLQEIVVQKIVDQECKKNNIAVSNEEIQAELERVASAQLVLLANGQPDTKGLVDMMCNEQKITADTYYNYVLRPMIALKKMATKSVQVTDEDMVKAQEAQFGPKVNVLAIFLNSQRTAFEAWEKARAGMNMAVQQNNPAIARDTFAKLAGEYSIEPTTQAQGGQIDPIARYSGWSQLEETAFALKDNDISEIISFDTINGKQYVILYCLGHTAPSLPTSLEQSIRQQMHDDIYDQKLALEVEKTLGLICSSAVINNYLAGKSQTPQEQQLPNTAAIPGAPVR